MKSKIIKRFGYVDLTRIINKKCGPITNDKPKQNETRTI